MTTIQIPFCCTFSLRNANKLSYNRKYRASHQIAIPSGYRWLSIRKYFAETHPCLHLLPNCDKMRRPFVRSKRNAILIWHNTTLPVLPLHNEHLQWEHHTIHSSSNCTNNTHSAIYVSMVPQYQRTVLDSVAALGFWSVMKTVIAVLHQ